jgi:hypothetical protein
VGGRVADEGDTFVRGADDERVEVHRFGVGELLFEAVGHRVLRDGRVVIGGVGGGKKCRGEEDGEEVFHKLCPFILVGARHGEEGHKEGDVDEADDGASYTNCDGLDEHAKAFDREGEEHFVEARELGKGFR